MLLSRSCRALTFLSYILHVPSFGSERAAGALEGITTDVSLYSVDLREATGERKFFLGQNGEMNEIVAIGFVTAADDQVGILFEFVERVRREAEVVAGFKSASLWMDLDLPEKYGIFLHFSDDRAAAETSALISETGIIDDALLEIENPPDIRQIQVLLPYGRSIGDLRNGEALSVSIRTADPGHGPELMDDVVAIFQGLKYIDGFLGAVVGTNTALDEEVVAIALWTDRHPFDTSVQRGSFYEIRLFERIA